MMTLVAIHPSLRYHLYHLVSFDVPRLIMNHNEDVGLRLGKVNLLLHLLLMNLDRIGHVLGNSLHWGVAADWLSHADMLSLLYDSLVIKDNWLLVCMLLLL